MTSSTVLAEIRNRCKCPVTNKFMCDPVIVDAPCHHTIDRSTFEERVGIHKKRRAKRNKARCPACNLKLRSRRVSPNEPLREVIEIVAKTDDDDDDEASDALLFEIRDRACACPVFQEMMANPVIVRSECCHHTVDQSTFEKWVIEQGRSTCPVCRSDLRSCDSVAPNEPLGEIVDILTCGESGKTPASATTRSLNPPRSMYFDKGVWGVFVGDLNERGQRNGHGSMKWEDGNEYVGQWKNDKREGSGTLTWSDGDVYEGQWVAGIEEGYGKHTCSDGNVYEGGFKQSYPEGQGIARFHNGNVYKGGFKRGLRSGQGTLKFADGEVYEGGWKDDKMNGAGTLEHVDGTVLVATFREGEIIEGVTMSANRRKAWSLEGELLWDDSHRGKRSSLWSDFHKIRPCSVEGLYSKAA